MPDFLPRRGAELLSWSSNFDQQINASPFIFGLSVEQSAEYAMLHASFAGVFRVASQPSTRTTSVIAAKNDAEKPLRAFARVLAGIARTCPTVTDAQLLTLGLRVRRLKPTRIPRPDHAPSLQLGWPKGGTVPVRLIDPRSPTRLAKPRDVTGATILTCIGDEPAATLDRWSHYAGVTVTNVEVKFPANLPPGTKVWITANWHNRRGRGPLAIPRFTHLGYGVSMAA